MDKIKLNKCYCYNLCNKNHLSEEIIMEVHVGYCFYKDDIKFDIFKRKGSWQLNWCGVMIEQRETLKEIKEFVSKDLFFIECLNQIKLKQVLPHDDYERLKEELLQEE